MEWIQKSRAEKSSNVWNKMLKAVDWNCNRARFELTFIHFMCKFSIEMHFLINFHPFNRFQHVCFLQFICKKYVVHYHECARKMFFFCCWKNWLTIDFKNKKNITIHTMCGVYQSKWEKNSSSLKMNQNNKYS